MNNNFRMTKIAAALATAGLAAVPSFAFAAVGVTTTAGITIGFRAPIVGTTFTPSFGLAARHSITRNGTAADLDGMEAVSFLYDSANAYVGFVRGGYANKATALTPATVTVPSASSGATQGVFALFYHGNEAAAGNASDDTLDGSAAAKSAIIFVPTTATGRTAFTASYLNANTANGAADYTTLSGATSAQLNTIGAHSSVNSAGFRVTLDSVYGGPVLSSAAKDALTPAVIRVNWNAGMVKPADDADVSATIVTKVGTTAKGTPNTRDACGQSGNFTQAAGDAVMYLRNTGNAAFTDAIDTITISGSSTTITDEAGNPAKVNNTGVTVSTFALPAYSGSGTVGIVNNNDTDAGGNLVQGAASETSLYTTGGLSTAAGDAVQITLRMSEAMSVTAWGATDDVAIASGGTAFTTTAWTTANSGQSLLTTATLGAGWFRVDTTSGKLQFGGTAATAGTFADITATVKKGATAVATLEGRALTADLAATSVFAGDAPPRSAVSTNDADTDGTIDGISVNYNAPLSALGTGPGFAIKSTAGTATLPSTFTIPAATPSIIVGTITNPGAADWNGDGTANAAADNTIFTTAGNFSTGVTAAAKYTFGSTAATGSATYSSIFDAATGNLLQIATAAQAAPTADGAKPLITKATFNEVQGSNPPSGNLVLVGSENLTAGTPSGSQFVATGSPLTLLNLNDGLADVTFAAATDTITISNVSKSALGKVLTIGTAPGYTDGGAGNVIATATAGVTIATGNTVFTQPKFIQAAAVRAGGAVGGNITSIILRLNKPVQFAPVGKVFDGAGVQSGATVVTAVTALEAGQFKVRANVPIAGTATAVDISLANADVNLSAASTGYITLNIPAPGIVGTATGFVVDYQNGVAAGARLVSTDVGTTGPTVFNVQGTAFQTAAVNIAVSGAGFDRGGDDNSIITGLAVNSNKLYIQEVKGKITLDGTAAVENGTIVRADLVKFDPATTVQRGNAAVPCDCSAGKQVVTLSINANLNAAIDDARRLGQTSIRAYVNTTKTVQNPSVVTAAIQAAPVSGAAPGIAANETQYEVAIDLATGAISSASGMVTGGLVIAVTPLLTTFDTTYSVLTTDNAGVFRQSAGVNTQLQANGLFWVVSVKRPTDTRFRMVTSGAPNLANFMPFLQELGRNSTAGTGTTASAIAGIATSTIRANLGTVNLANLIDIPVAATTTWQLLPVKGAVAITTDAVRKLVNPTMQRLLMNVQASDGTPNTAWSGDGDTDEAFELVGNTISGAVQIATQTAAIDNIFGPQGGIGLAVQNAGGSYRTAAPLGGAQTTVAIATATPLFVTLPITAANSANRDMPAGWSLITMNTNRDLSVAANQSTITAAILVGGGQQSKTWFKGEAAAGQNAGNTLTTLDAGKSYFVLFSAPALAFVF